MIEYKNHLPEQLDYNTGSQFSDIQMIRKAKSAMGSDEVVAGECIKTTESGEAVIKLGPRLRGIIPRSEITYIKEQSGRVHKGRSQKLVYLNIKATVKDVIEGDPEHSAWYHKLSKYGKEYVETLREEDSNIPIVILSRKDVMEKIRDEYVENLKKGHKVQAVVTGFKPYGAFIDLGGDVAGLLYTGDICATWIEKPEDKLNIGDPIDVVLKKDLDIIGDVVHAEVTRKPLFKQWKDIDKYYKRGEVVRGIVKNPYAFGGTGIFIEIGDDYEGLADYNGERYSYGDKVRVRINSIDKEKERIKFKIIY
jgi:ribosomal protein S1